MPFSVHGAHLVMFMILISYMVDWKMRLYKDDMIEFDGKGTLEVQDIVYFNYYNTLLLH